MIWKNFGENNVNGLESISAKCLEQLGFYIKIFIIFYADDTVIMSETEEGLQQALLNSCNTMHKELYLLDLLVFFSQYNNYRYNIYFLCFHRSQYCSKFSKAC
jgi:hypothetical protein